MSWCGVRILVCIVLTSELETPTVGVWRNPLGAAGLVTIPFLGSFLLDPSSSHFGEWLNKECDLFCITVSRARKFCSRSAIAKFRVFLVSVLHCHMHTHLTAGSLRPRKINFQHPDLSLPQQRGRASRLRESKPSRPNVLHFWLSLGRSSSSPPCRCLCWPGPYSDHIARGYQW